jgi:hypothetical protein
VGVEIDVGVIALDPLHLSLLARPAEPSRFTVCQSLYTRKKESQP